MPGGCERACLGLAVSNNAGRDEVRVIKHRAESVRKTVTELAAFVDGTGNFGRDVGGGTAGE